MMVEFEGLDHFSNRNFVKFILIEEAGMILPTFELVLFQTDYSLYPYVSRNNLPIQITFGTVDKPSKTYKFSLSNYKYFPAENGFHLSLTGMLELREFTTTQRTEAFKMTDRKSVV